MSNVKLLVLLLSLCHLFGLTAVAQNQKVIVESRIIGEPEVRLPAFYDELSRRGYRALIDSPKAVVNAHSSSGHQLKSSETASTEAQLKQGIALYLEGKFKKSKELLEAAWLQKMCRPAIVARNQTLRDSSYQALVYLALVSNRLRQQSKAKSYVEEFMRSFPDREVSSRQFGPEASSLFLKHGAEYIKKAKEQLNVSLDDSSAVVFVNERYVGVGEQNMKLLPGDYRIYTQRGSLAGRVFKLNVRSNSKMSLHSSSVKDKAIVTEDHFFLSFDSKEDQDKYALDFAYEIAGSLNAKELVLVQSQDQTVFGTHADVPQKRVLGKVKSDYSDGGLAPKEQRLFATKTLSNTLQDWPSTGNPKPSRQKNSDAGAQEVQTLDLQNTRSSSNVDSGISSWWRYSAWTIGIAGVASGAVLLKLHCDLTNDGLDRFNTIDGGLALVGGGAAFLVTGFVLWAFESKESNFSFDYDPSNNKYGAVFSGQF